MKNKKLYVLAKIIKKPWDVYVVTFLFSDKDKNFKRVADCTPEIQELARFYSLDTLAEGTIGYFRYFDCDTKETFVAPPKMTPDWLERKLILDSFHCEMDDDRTAWHVISHYVCKITNYGEEDNGKVFMKCGRNAKVEIEFSVEMEKIDEILDEYLGV